MAEEFVNTINISFENFVNINEREKELILKWRNSDRIRNKMTNQEMITLENHLKWINALKEKNNQLYFLFKINKIPCGVFDFTKINKVSCECGSYIGNEDYIGYGILLNFLGFNYAFEKLKLEKVDITVLKNNNRVYKMHKTIFHAQDVAESENEYFLQLTSDQWQTNKKELENNLTSYYGTFASQSWEK